MKKWDNTIDLSLRWKEGWNNHNIPEMGEWVAKQIVKAIPDYADYDKYGFELEEIVDNFTDGICTMEEAMEINQDNYNYHLQQLVEGKDSLFYEITPLEEFDNYMNELYDFCDRENIWVKTTF